MGHKAVAGAAMAPPLAGGGRLGRLAALGAFVMVETAAELVRRHMVKAGEGPFSSAPAALVAMSIWTYLAHTRYAFRLSTRTGLSTLPPYAVVCLGLAVARSGLWRGVPAAGEMALFASATLLKFGVLRLWLWPPGRDRTPEIG